ncbi:hypothetical protein HN011_000056 [Eciton burchellii]|nr:hypothetical protein HN011_000056 [Eciton burchellii]
MNALIPLPVLLTTSSLSLETQLCEIITESGKACATFLRNSLRRATSLGWAANENFETMTMTMTTTTTTTTTTTAAAAAAAASASEAM